MHFIQIQDTRWTLRVVPQGSTAYFARLVQQRMHVSLFAYCEDIGHQMFIDGEDGDLHYGHDEELYRAGLTQNRSEGDQDCGCAEVCVDYSAG